MGVTREELLPRIKAALQAAHGARLKGVILYGSRARGDAQADSDWDVLVLLEGPVNLGRDIDTCVHAVYPLMLEYDILIETVPTSVENYTAQEFPLYRNAKREGVLV